MNIITDSIKNEKEYSGLISAVFSETGSKNPRSISVTGPVSYTHLVLKLVPESVCSSGLIKSRSSAYSAGVYLPRKKMIEKFAHAFILCVEIKSGDGNRCV